MTKQASHSPESDPKEQTVPAGETLRPKRHKAMDRLIAVTWLLAFPRWIKPNHLTVVRLLLVPLVVVLLVLEHRGWALATFIIALCTDFIDGAMARTRDQISTFGIYADPIADKLLVASVLGWWVWRYFDPHSVLDMIVPIFLGFIALELVVTSVGVPMLLRTGQSQSSNAFGKIKMIVQSLALFLFLIAAIRDLETLTTVSLYLLWAALALAMISGGQQMFDMRRRRGSQEA